MPRTYVYGHGRISILGLMFIIWLYVLTLFSSGQLHVHDDDCL